MYCSPIEANLKITSGSDDAPRLAYLVNPKKFFIKHSVVMRITEEFDYLINLGDSYGGRGMVLTGHSGAGKTRLCEKICEKYSRHEKPDVSIIPVLKIDCPAKPTAKGIMQAMLEVYSPDDYSGTSNMLEARVKHYIRSCSTKLIIIDEIEHLLHPAGGKELTVEGINTLTDF